jgi:hypothetical protein
MRQQLSVDDPHGVWPCFRGQKHPDSPRRHAPRGDFHAQMQLWVATTYGMSRQAHPILICGDILFEPALEHQK